MNNITLFATLFTLITCAACSNQSLYSGAKASQQNDCQRLPESQYEECMEDASTTYDEYKKTREEIIGDDS